MNDKEKLLKLADWFDVHDAKIGIKDTAVQTDLRRMAKSLEAKDAEIARLRKALDDILETNFTDPWVKQIANRALERAK